MYVRSESAADLGGKVAFNADDLVVDITNEATEEAISIEIKHDQENNETLIMVDGDECVYSAVGFR